MFFGSLSDLGFTLRVHDREGGQQVVYEVEPGERISHADTEAFAAESGAGNDGTLEDGAMENREPEGVGFDAIGFDSTAPDG